MLSRKTILISLIVAFLPSVAMARYFDVADGHLTFGDWSFDPWGIEWSDAFATKRDTLACLAVLQKWNSHGVNTIILSAQEPGHSLYNRDGQLANDQIGETYKKTIEVCRFHLFPTIINLFSADPAQSLASADAYRTAVATAIKNLPVDYYGVLLVGDVVTGQKWSADHPCPLDRLDNVFALCREVRKRNSSVLLGVPADVFPGASSTGPHQPVIYVARKSETLEQLAAHLAKPNPGAWPPDLARDVFVLPANRLCLQRNLRGAHDTAVQDYLQRVERERLAIKAPEAVDTQPADQAVQLLAPEEKAQGWLSLFDGHSFNGWTTLRTDWGAWRIEDGTITCDGSKLGPWLRTRRRFGSFILRLEYRISDKGNSGVFVHAPLDGRSSRFGFETQIMGRHFDQCDDNHTTGAIYAALPPKEDASLPVGQWNKMEITCRGTKVQVRVNGQLVQDFDTQNVELLKDRLHEGVIGLQDHGNKVWFRKIRIKELSADVR